MRIIRMIKNLIGNFLEYGSCPNCGDSWWWKESKEIPYGKEENITYLVSICKECLSIPSQLDESRIRKDLAAHECSTDEADMVVKAAVAWEEKRLAMS